MEETINKQDLEQRLIDFVILVIRITGSLDYSYAAKHIKEQLTRSGTSSALHYGEVQDSESADDFIHKVKVILKELRESFIALKIIKNVPLTKNTDLVNKGIMECNELISIFVKSVDTAKKNKLKRK